MINFTSGTPEKGKPSSCTPPALNGDPSRAVPVGDPGQGACITRPHGLQHALLARLAKSNLDSTGLRLVEKGRTVHFKHIKVPGIVMKTSRGWCFALPVGWAAPVVVQCHELEVVL